MLNQDSATSTKPAGATRSQPMFSGSAWINFPLVLCQNWVMDDRVVLIGDAAHTAHFSIGSGTKLSLEDATSLAKHLSGDLPMREALHAYQDERELEKCYDYRMPHQIGQEVFMVTHSDASRDLRW